jgi:DNA-binding response OmpR family regulator
MARLLLVSRAQPDRHPLTGPLEAAGYRVRTADSITRATPPLSDVDVIVLDASAVSGVSTVDVCRSVRATPAAARLPILVVGGRLSEPEIRAGLAAGASHYLGEPVTEAALLSRLRHLLTSSAIAAAALAGLTAR